MAGVQLNKYRTGVVNAGLVLSGILLVVVKQAGMSDSGITPGL